MIKSLKCAALVSLGFVSALIVMGLYNGRGEEAVLNGMQAFAVVCFMCWPVAFLVNQIEKMRN